MNKKQKCVKFEKSLIKHMSLLEGKKGIILGVANAHSLAWGIAKELSNHGGEIAFTYQSDILKKRVQPLAESIGSSLLFHCDMAEEDHVEKLFIELKKNWESIDFVVHAVAFSDKDELRGEFIQVSRENFMRTLDISCYSFIEVVKHAMPMMNEGGSFLTLSYYGAEKVVPHYNVMGVAKAALEASVRYIAEDIGKKGIRVNAISCGPIKTLAASGIGDFHYILQWNQNNAPLRRGITLEDVGKSALYCLSDLSSGVTGEIIHVDSGYHVVGMKAKDAPDIVLPKNHLEN